MLPRCGPSGLALKVTGAGGDAEGHYRDPGREGVRACTRHQRTRRSLIDTVNPGENNVFLHGIFRPYVPFREVP